MKRLIAVTALLLAAVAFPSVVLGEDILGDDLKISDHGSTAQVVSVSGGQAVQLDYFYSGLGSQTVTITVDAATSCTNAGVGNGGNEPPGHISASSGPIQPENGNVQGTLTTGPASCPDHMTANIGPTVTVTLSRAGKPDQVFVYTV
jgi:hypothetical protein